MCERFCDVAPRHRGGGKSKCAIQLLPWSVVVLVLLLPVVDVVTASSTTSRSPSASPSASPSDSPSVSPSDSPSDSPTPSLSLMTPTDSTHSRTATHRSRSFSLSLSFTTTDTSSFTSTDTPSFTRNAISATMSVSSMRSNTESGSLTGASNSGTTSDDNTASHASVSVSPTASRSRHYRTESSTPTESMTPERTVATPSDSTSASLSNSTTPTWSQSPTSSASVSPSLSHSRTLTHSLSNTSSQGTATISRTPDASLTMSLSQTASTSSSNSFGSRTLSRSMKSRTLSSTRGSISKTASTSPSAAASGSPTTTTSRTSSQSLSFTAAVSGGTISGTPSLSQGTSVTIDTQSPSQSTSSTVTSTITPPPTPTKTESASASQAFSSSVSSSRGTPSVTASPQKSQSDSPTFSQSPSVSASATQSESHSTTTSASPDRTASPTNSLGTPSTSNTSSPSMTLSLTVSRATLSAMVTGSQTDTESPSLTRSMSSSLSLSPTADTPTPDASLTSTPSPSNSISVSPSRASATWQGTSSVSASNELSLSAASVSPTLTVTPSPTLTVTPTSSDSNEPTTTSTASSSATASAEETVTATLTSTQTLTDTTTTTDTMTMTDEASLSFSGTMTRSMSDEATDTAVSGSPSPTLSASSSVSTSEEVTGSPTTTMSEDVTPSASSSLSGSPSLTPSPEPSRSRSLSMSSSPSDTDTEPDSVTRSPSTSKSLTPEPSVTFSTTDTLTRTSTRSNPSMTLTMTKNLCDDVYFDNISDVFSSVDVVARAGQSLSSLVASPDGNESTVYYQLSRVEFGQLKSGLAVTLHTATPIRNMYGQTSPIWTPMPVVTNCALSNFTIVDMYTFSFALSYISNEQIGVSTSYACTLVFRNDAFACPELLGSVGNRSLLNVTAAIRIVGGEAATSFWDSLAQTLGTIAGILSGGAALLHQSRASSINSFADCLYSLVDPPSIGDHPLGFGFGPEVGYYLRGAVVGNACFFFIVVVAHSLVVIGLTIRSYFVEYYDPMHPPTDTTTSRNLREVMDEADAGVDVKKKEKLKRVQLSRAQFPLRHELQYQASIARFPSASVAGAVLTYDGTCTASVGLILHNVTDYDQALGVLGLIFVASFIVVQFMITKTYFRCGSKKLSRKYKDIDTPTESSEDDEQTTTSGGRNNKSLTIGPRRPVLAATGQAQHHSSSLIELVSVGDENPDAPPAHLLKDTTTLQKRNAKKANQSEEGEDLHEAPPSASKRLSFWLFSARMKWLRLDRYPYFKGMFMSLFEDYTIAYFGCAELIVSLIIGTASGVMISERSICNALAGLSLTCLFIFILGMLYANPFINRLDLFHSLAANSFAFLGAILLFIYSRQLQPDQSLANAAANLATMVSVLNVIKFLTDIFAKGKQFRQFIGIEGRERMRESKKKHLKVLKKSMLLAAQGKQASGHGNIFSGASSNGSDDIFSDAASDSSHHVGSLEPHKGTARRGARHAGRTGKMQNVEATSSDGSMTERVNWDLNSSWSGRGGATNSPGASATEGARLGSFGDDPLGRPHRSRRAMQRHKGEHHNHHPGSGTSLSTMSRSPTPQPMSTSARAWALEELGLDTTRVDLSVPLQDDAAFDAQWDNAAFLGRFASGDIRYAPPPPALTSLDDLQDRIDSQKYIDGPPQATLYLPKAMQSKLTQHVLASKSHGNQHHHRGSGAGSRATVGGGGIMFGNSPALKAAAGAQPLVAGGGLTGHDIERAIAVEQDVRRDAQWFGGILSTSTQRGTHVDGVQQVSEDRRHRAEDDDAATIGRRRLSTFFPTTSRPRPNDAEKYLDDVFDVL